MLPHRPAPSLPHRAWIVMLSLLCVGVGAQAGTTAHRCTDAQGRVTYSQAPCHNAQSEATLDQLDDTRTAAQRRQADEMAHRDHMLVQRMARDRRHLERQAEDAHVQRLNPVATRQVQQAHTHGSGQADPHAPVPTYQCKPPRCYEARLPKPHKHRSPAATGAASSAS